MIVQKGCGSLTMNKERKKENIFAQIMQISDGGQVSVFLKECLPSVLNRLSLWDHKLPILKQGFHEALTSIVYSVRNHQYHSLTSHNSNICQKYVNLAERYC